MKTSLSATAACAAALLFAAAAPKPAHSADAGTELSTAAPHFGPWGFDLAGRDLAVQPGDDFYAYAAGTYLRDLKIPADRVTIW